MSDLHEQLTALDRVPAPDLWSQINARAREPAATYAAVDALGALDARRSTRGPLVLAAAVIVALLVAVNLAGRSAPTTTVGPAVTPAEPTQWQVGVTSPPIPRPYAVAVGHGAVWVVGGDDALYELDPLSGRVRDRIAVGHAPVDVTTGPTGVWVASREAGTVTWVDPKTKATKVYEAFSGVWSVVDAGDEVKVVRDATIDRIYPESGQRGGVADGPGGGRSASWAGSSVWVAQPVQGRVVRDDRTAPVSYIYIEVPDAQTIVADDERVWVAAINGTDRLYRIDPATNTAAPRGPAGWFDGLALEGDVLWAANNHTDRVLALDADTGALIDEVTVGSGPQDMAGDDGSVWVCLFGEDTVVRVDPVKER